MAWRLRSAAKFDFYTVLHEPALLEDGQVRHTQAPEHDPKTRVVRRPERAAPARADREYYSRRDSNPQSSP